MIEEALKCSVYSIILEGSECGGDIGLMTSLVLCERALEHMEEIKNTIASASATPWKQQGTH